MRPVDGRIETAGEWCRLVAVVTIAFGVFHWSASALSSGRGQWGLLVCVVVLLTILLADRVLFRRPVAAAIQTLALRRPRFRGLLAAAAVSALLLSTIAAFAWTTEGSVGFYPGWPWLVPGLFAQAGIAEEALFRGYLFGRVRIGRSFWTAAALSALPFVLVHLLMFATMPWPVATAAILLAAVLSFPLAWLFDLSGQAIWPPALLHFTIQGAVKVMTVSGGSDTAFPLFWMLAAAVVPLAVLLIESDGRAE